MAVHGNDAGARERPAKLGDVAADIASDPRSAASLMRGRERQGLMDDEIASIDETWSGLKFTRKKP